MRHASASGVYLILYIGSPVYKCVQIIKMTGQRSFDLESLNKLWQRFYSIILHVFGKFTSIFCLHFVNSATSVCKPLN